MKGLIFVLGFFCTSTPAAVLGGRARLGFGYGVAYQGPDKWSVYGGLTDEYKYPVVSLNAVHPFGTRYALRSYLEIQDSHIKYGTGSMAYPSNLYQKALHAALTVNLRWMYIGGGFGLSSGKSYFETVNRTWLVSVLGLDIGKYLFLELRPCFDMTQEDMWGHNYIIGMAGIRFYEL